jgi:glycosyltransferase involved in cell wall biosynthesis
MALRSVRILTVSDYSKRRIAGLVGVPVEKITVTGGAPGSKYRPTESSVRTRSESGLPEVEDFVLGFASAAPRKNTRLLMEVYAELPMRLRRAHPLVLVCTHTSAYKACYHSAQSLGIAESTFLVSQPSDDQLLLLYNAALVFVFPSLDEGFGLPPLEAMSCGTPVIAADAGSLPEILGEAALLVDPSSRDELLNAMVRALTQPDLRVGLAQRGLDRRGLYSWDMVARRTLQVYEDVLLNVQSTFSR